VLAMVEMTVHLPPDLDKAEAECLKAKEKTRFQELQRAGKWRHVWRVVGHYANVSIFDVESNLELHNILTTLPLYPFMSMKVTPLCRHPSSMHEDDR
jgi:muconolactone D-isomerase